jgi:hypothetical protein
MKKQRPFFAERNTTLANLENTAKAILIQHGFDVRTRFRFEHQEQCCSTIIYVDRPDQVDAYARLAIKKTLNDLGNAYKISLTLSYIPSDVSEAVASNPGRLPTR